jgi:hypothetical protein
MLPPWEACPLFFFIFTLCVLCDLCVNRFFFVFFF